MLQGKRKELYVIRSTDIYPSSITANTGGQQPEYGQYVGFPVAADDNRPEELPLSIIGELRYDDIVFINDSGNDLTIGIQEGGIRYDAKGNDIKLATNRFTVKFANDDKTYCPNPDWYKNETSTINLAASSIYSSAHSGYSPVDRERPKILSGPDGKMYLVCLGENVSDHRIFIFVYDPSTDGPVPVFTKLVASNVIEDEGNQDAFENPRLSACFASSGEILIIVTDEGLDVASPSVPRSGTVNLYSYVIDGDIRLINTDIFKTTQEPDFYIDGGCAIGICRDKYVVAIGIRKSVSATINTYEIERSVYVASSTDLINWTSSLHGRNSLGRVEVHNSEFNDVVVTCIDQMVLEENNLMFATTTNGEILRSVDDGANWSKVPNPATGKVPLYSVKAIKGPTSEDVIVYAGGAKGFFMRSIDGGTTWKIIAGPAENPTVRPSFKGPGFGNPFAYNWRYEYTEAGQQEDYINEAYGWKVKDLELPSEPNDHLEGNYVVPGLNRDIHTLVKYEERDSNGVVNSVFLFLIFDKGYFILKEANDKDIENNWIQPELRTNKTTDRLVAGYIIKTPGYITSACTVGDDLLCSGMFRNTEEIKDVGKVPYAARPGWNIIPHFMRITDPTVPKPATDQKNPNYTNGFFFSTDMSDSEGPDENARETGEISTVSDVVAIDENSAYGIDENGLLVLWQKNTTASEILYTNGKGGIPPTRDRASIKSNTLFDTAPMFTEIAIAKEDLGDVQSIVVLNDKLEILRSINDGISWQKFAISERANKEPTTNVQEAILVGDLFCPSPEVIVAGLGNKLISFGVGQRVYPEFCTTSNGTLYMTTSDLEGGYVEIWRAYEKDVGEDFLVSFKKIAPFTDIEDEANGKTISFPTPSGDDMVSDSSYVFVTIPDTTPYATMLELPEGILAIFAGTSIIACTNGTGTYWVDAKKDPSIPLKLKALDITSSFTREFVNKTASYVVAHGGRILATMTGISDELNTFECRRWNLEQTGSIPLGMPIILNKPQWIGVGNLEAVWSATPFVTNEYTLPIEYRFGRKNLGIESPSAYWRSGSWGGGHIDIIFNREDEELTQILGTGSAFLANCLGIIGSNFPRCKWAITVPDYDGSTFPTDKSQFTEFDMSAVVVEGTFTAPTGVGSYIRDPAKKFKMDEFFNGVEQHYISVQVSDEGDLEYRKITGNTEDFIFYEGPKINFASLTSDGVYQVFTDHMFSDGTNGEREGEVQDPCPPLFGTEYEMGKFIRVRIFNNTAPAEGYLKLSNIFIGRQFPVEFTINGLKRDATKFSNGWRWALQSNSNEITALNGVSVVSTYGQTGYKLSLQYDQIEDWEVQVYANVFSRNPKQSFILVPDPEKPTSSLYVRLDDDPSFNQDGGIHFSHGVSLKAVK